MSKLREGDRVRVEFEATYEDSHGSSAGRIVRSTEHPDTFWILPSSAVLTPIEPDEPPVGSVVIDRYGTAHQRSSSLHSDRWVSVLSGDGRSWAEMQTVGGLTVAYEPPVEF